MDLNTKYDPEQESPSLLDEFKDFLIELWDMIKADFSNSINFISSNRSFFTTAALLAILLQVSSVSNLGASFEKYCGGRNGMHGGGSGEPMILTFEDVQAAKAQEQVDKKAQATKDKRAKKIDKKSDKLVEKMMAADIKKGPSSDGSGSKTKEQYKGEAEHEIISKAKAQEDFAALKKGKSSALSQYRAKKAGERDNDKLMKANKERISFFEGIKKKFNSTLSPGALGGPLFGRLDLIFDSVKDVFYIIAIILTIAGILSLPVLVFLIITYYVFKNMLGKFIIL